MTIQQLKFDKKVKSSYGICQKKKKKHESSELKLTSARGTTNTIARCVRADHGEDTIRTKSNGWLLH